MMTLSLLASVSNTHCRASIKGMNISENGNKPKAFVKDVLVMDFALFASLSREFNKEFNFIQIFANQSNFGMCFR